jgi:rubrerythrin
MIDKEVAVLKKNSHPRADWICLECGCNAIKKENPTKKGD